MTDNLETSTGRRPHLMVLGTGGTIAGSAPDPANGAVYESSIFGINTLLAALPQIAAVAELDYEQLDNIDSKNASPAFWLRLAQRVTTLLERKELDGVVITHGTDTLEETAFFLDLVLAAGKPVVMTAAMRPANALSPDGPLNLMDALHVAADNRSAGRGVMVVVAGQIHAARSVTKVHTSSVDAFSSGEAGQLGTIHGARPQFFSAPFARALKLPLPTRERRKNPAPGNVIAATGNRDALLPTVEIIYCHAGVSRLFLGCAVDAGTRGIVLAAMGNGSLNDELEHAAAAAAAKGVAIVRSTRVAHGGVQQRDAQAGSSNALISASMLPPAKARILLMLALAAGIDAPQTLQELFAGA